MRRSKPFVVVRLGADLAAFAQCVALDATVFPSSSVPALIGTQSPVWIARDDGRVVGFVATAACGTALAISGLAVAPSHRRLGVGRTLLREVMRHATHAHLATVRLHVSVTNIAAIALYEAEGFEVRARLAGFYHPRAFGGDGDALEMVLAL